MSDLNARDFGQLVVQETTPGSAKILVVDDEANVAYTIAEVLRRHGHEVETALSGEEAIARIEEARFDLVLTDLRLEGVDGIYVLEEVRKRRPLTVAIIMTGYASLESAIAAIRQDAYDYLVKPCGIDELVRTVNHGLEYRRLLEAEQRNRTELEQLNAELEQRVAERTEELRHVNQELAEANRAKDIFFATLSHELRTPLHAIIGWTNLLRREKLSKGESSRALEIIERNARQQAYLVSDILDLSRIVTGKFRLEMRPVDLALVVTAAVDAIRPTAESKEIKLTIGVESRLEPVTADPDRLSQVIANLLSNAVKFTPEGGSVSVNVKRIEDEVQIAVSDTGQGIHPEFLPHVFDSFSQADASFRQVHGGLGLGLAIVRHITELHGGWVRAESSGEGKGATFTVSIPLNGGEAVNAQKAASTGEKEESEKLLNGLNIVVVEDQKDTLQLITTILERSGARVSQFSSVSEALGALQWFRPDLLISDIAMPGQDGYTLIRKLRRRGLDSPAIALTGLIEADPENQALSAGFDRCLAKPVSPEELIQEVAALARR